MRPKRGPDGRYLDHHTTTVGDAAQFEAYWNAEPPDRDYDPGHPCEHCEEAQCDSCSFEPREDDPCGCSDPCCPCSGLKGGVGR